MNCGRTATVVVKELIDSFRDRRTMLVSLVTALLAGPVFLVLVLNMAANQAERARELQLPIVGAGDAPALVDFLVRQQVAIVPAPTDYESRLRAGDFDVVLVVDARYASDVAAGRAGTIRVVADRSRDRSRSIIGQTESLLRAYNRLWGTQRLLLRGVAIDVGQPLDIETVDLATPQQSGSIILFLVAFYGLFATVMGGMASAIDTTAGERERGSLEPLLATPLTPLEIATGKWLAIAAFNALVVVSTLAGFYLTLRFAPLPSIGVPFLFGAKEFARFLVILAPLALLLPGVLLYIGLRGRTLKEAQANISVLMFVLSMIPAIQLFLQRREPPWLQWVPISGQYALLNRALRGDALPALELLQAAVLPVLLAIVAVLAAARLLNRESMLASR